MSSVACIQWIRDELETHGDLKTLDPPLVDTKSLCEFVTDGRALCLLTNAVLEGEEQELPKKLQRSLRQASKFHALERVQFFIKWCRTRAKLEEHQVFTTVQLLDEVNEIAVSETIVALRNKTRPGSFATTPLSQFYSDGDKNRASSTTSTSSTNSSGANNASRLSSFLHKFPSAPVVTTQPVKPPATRVSLTSSVSSNSSPRELDEPVPDEDATPKSRLCIPSIFKTNNTASGTPRSSVLSNASSTASTSKDDGPDSRSRSWSNKLSAFSRSVSSSNASAPQSSPTAPDGGSNNTPPFSPPASPPNRVSIPSAFRTPARAAPKSLSKLSAFLSSVEPTPATPASSAPSRKDKSEEATPEVDSEAEDNQDEGSVSSEDVGGAEDTEEDVEIEQESVSKVEPQSLETEALEEDDDFVAVEAEEEPAEVVEKECFSEEDEDAVDSERNETGNVSDVEESGDEVGTVEALQQEMNEDDEDSFEDEVAEERELKATVLISEAAKVSSELEQEKNRLAMENAALTQKLQTAEALVAAKDTEVQELTQEVELVKAQLVKEQTHAREVRVAAKEQDTLVAHAAAAQAKLVMAHEATETKELEDAKGLVKELTVQNEGLVGELTSLREEFRTLEQSVQLARDSEEAARYAAQVAFAARDSADEMIQHYKNELAK